MPFERHRVEISDGCEVQVASVGRGEPVVFLHSEGFFGCIWAPIVQRLGNTRAILIDFPGHGCSDTLDLSEGDLRATVTDVVQRALDAVEVSSAAWVGSGWGGQCALWAALDLPDRVGKLVLAGNPAAALPGSRPKFGLSRLGTGTPEWLARRRLRKAIGGAAFDSLSELQIKLYLTARRRSEWGQAAKALRNRLERERPGLSLGADDLGRIAVPTLIYWGYNEPSASPSVAQETVEAMPDAELQMAPGGPMPHLDDPYRFSEILETFLS